MTFRPNFLPQYRSSRSVAVALAVVGMLALGACSSSAPDGGSPSTPANGGGGTSGATGSGPVSVLYAGSLVDLMTKQISPGFEKSSGYSFSGFPDGSTDLATDIKGKTRKADVFVSASPKADKAIQGASNGDWVSWYGTFATAKLVLGYNPKSTFASDLKSKPWYDVVTESGFRLGKTDPATDPKGELAQQALADTGKSKNLAALTKMSTSQDGVYPEATLVGRLQAGQLDAGFFYAPEAVAAGIKTVPLTGTNLSATYTATVVNRAPNATGGAAFVKYLLGPTGQAALTKDGFDLVTPPTVTGSGVPASLSSVLSK